MQTYSIISTHTLRGERDTENGDIKIIGKISTHTLRGERDNYLWKGVYYEFKFQLTRSVGSVTTTE